MNIHEYQAKQLLAQYGVAVPGGKPCKTPEEARAIAQELFAAGQKLDLGLHVDLGEWRFTNGNWTAVYEVVSQDNETAVKEEIHRQLESFIRIVGRNPSHIDSHQHVHMQKSIQPYFLEIARKLNVTLRRCSENVNYCGDFYGQNSDSSPLPESISKENLCRIISPSLDQISSSRR